MPLPSAFQLITDRDPFCDPLALLPLSSIAFVVPAAFSMLLKLRYNPDSNPTLSASIFVIWHLDVVIPRLIAKIRKGSPVNREVNVTKRVKTLQGLR